MKENNKNWGQILLGETGRLITFDLSSVGMIIIIIIRSKRK
jgi:hypothetical protein